MKSIAKVAMREAGLPCDEADSKLCLGATFRRTVSTLPPASQAKALAAPLLKAPEMGVDYIYVRPWPECHEPGHFFCL